jgi:hypothetical protein
MWIDSALGSEVCVTFMYKLMEERRGEEILDSLLCT